MQENCLVELMNELVKEQKKKLLAFAREIIPTITEEDLLQPFDYPILENHPGFRYEEGILEGLMSAEMALVALFAETPKF